MTIMQNPFRIFGAFLPAVLLMSGISLAGNPSPTIAIGPQKGRCDDAIPGVAAIVPKLDCKFFNTTETSYQSWIVEHDDGTLENTMGGTISSDELLRVEHTAQCTSSHQGKHAMEYCDAVATGDGVKLMICGGMPAYASDLTVTIHAKRDFTCAFSAVYPAPTNPLRWKVTRKALKLKSTGMEPGSRLHGWISVEFEEIDDKAKESHSYKIEGYFKPVIQSVPKDDPTDSSGPTGAAEPVVPAQGKPSVKDQSPTRPVRE